MSRSLAFVILIVAALMVVGACSILVDSREDDPATDETSPELPEGAERQPASVLVADLRDSACCVERGNDSTVVHRWRGVPAHTTVKTPSRHHEVPAAHRSLGVPGEALAADRAGSGLATLERLGRDGVAA